MRQVIAQIWDKLRTSFWFIPLLLAILSGVLSFVMVGIDEIYAEEAPMGLFFIYAGGPDGARAVLTTVATSMIGVGGTVFSITMAVLSLASNTFGSRLLRSFMRDRANQIVLGVFVATFLYCLLVMRTVRSVDENRFVPYYSVTVGILLAVASLAALIFFIHHIASSIQAERIAASVAHDLDIAMDKPFPRGVGEDMSLDEAQAEELQAQFDAEGVAIIAPESGYLQMIRTDDLMETATMHDLIIRVELHPGNFAIAGTPIAYAIPRHRVETQVSRRLARLFIVGRERTAPQDVEYALDQLVEIASRALSTGINDPFTAIACIDRLAAAVSRLATREAFSPYRQDKEGNLRLIVRPFTFHDVVDRAFDQVRQYSRRDISVTIRLLESYATILSQLRQDDQRMVVFQQAQATWRGIREMNIDPIDLPDLQHRLRLIQQAFYGTETDSLGIPWGREKEL